MLRRALVLVLALVCALAVLTPAQVGEVQRLNAAHKQTGVYITRLRHVAHPTTYQRQRLAFWLAKRAEYKARIAAIKAQAPQAPKPATAYVGGAPSWDQRGYMVESEPYVASTILGQRLVWHPSGQKGLPVFVVIPGGPLPPDDTRYGGINWSLAGRGAVVFDGVYRSQRFYDGGSPQAFQDVSCTIAAARALAPSFGGDPSRITLVAHSFGGFIATQVVLGDWPPGPGCLYGGNYKPDQYVGIGAISSTEQVGSWFLATDYPDARQVEPALRTARKIPVLVIWGSWDNVARINEYSGPFLGALRSAGWPAQGLVGEWDHSGILVADSALDLIAR